MARNIGNLGFLSDPVGAPDFTLPVSILAQVIESLRVDIAAQSIPLLNIKLASVGDVTLNVSITGTPTVNIQTSGGANIIIDKLTQGAYTERRSQLANNGTSALFITSTGSTRYGKFFPRGCRGFIGTVDVYCYDGGTGGGTITVYVSPCPGMGPVYSADVSVPSGALALWRSASFNRHWNYDSMFIWVYGSSANMMIGYDTGAPQDAFYSADGGVSWSADGKRLWVRLNLSGETVGDLPVSGTVNTIGVPSSVTSTPSGFVTIPAGEMVNLFTFYGAGECVYLMLYAEHEGMCFSIKVDGSEIYFMPHTGELSWQPVTWYYYFGDVNAGVGVVQTKRDTTNGRFACEVTLPISFKRSLSVDALNTDTASSRRGGAVAVIKRIS
jgi:hypothetical protein